MIRKFVLAFLLLALLLVALIFNGVEATAKPALPRIQSLTCDRTLAPFETGTCTLTLTAKAPGGGMQFRITSTPSGKLTTPIIVTVLAGKTSVVFQIVAASGGIA